MILAIKSRRLRLAGHVAYMEERRVAYRVMVGKPEGRRSFVRPRHRCEDNIKMDLQKVVGGMEWIDLAQSRDRWRVVVDLVMNLRVP
jgi:hypothetical protein